MHSLNKQKWAAVQRSIDCKKRSIRRLDVLSADWLELAKRKMILIRGAEYSRSGQTIITTRVDNIFDNPNTTPEKVAAFVSQLADPVRIDVCRRVCQAIRIAPNSKRFAI